MARLLRRPEGAEEARLADASVDAWTSADDREEIARLYAVGDLDGLRDLCGTVGVLRGPQHALWGLAHKRRRAAVADWAARHGVPLHLAERRFVGDPYNLPVVQRRPRPTT